MLVLSGILARLSAHALRKRYRNASARAPTWARRYWPAARNIVSAADVAVAMAEKSARPSVTGLRWPRNGLKAA